MRHHLRRHHPVVAVALLAALLLAFAASATSDRFAIAVSAGCESDVVDVPGGRCAKTVALALGLCGRLGAAVSGSARADEAQDAAACTATKDGSSYYFVRCQPRRGDAPPWICDLETSADGVHRQREAEALQRRDAETIDAEEL